MRPATRSSPPDEGGFTLVELLLTVTLLGIVMVPVAASFVIGLRATGEASQRITDSRAAQISAAFFAVDVQSAATVTVADPSPCGGAGGASVVSFRWSDDLSVGNVASYVVRTSGPVRQLVRVRCRGPVVVDSIPLARDLAAAAPTVTCLASCAAPRRVSMRVTERSGYAFDVQGTRRLT